MYRISLRKLGIAGITILILVASIFSIAFIARARQNAPFVLNNQTAPLVSRARMVGPAGAQQQLNLSVGLHLRNSSELSSLLSDLHNPRSPRYHHFLTPQEFLNEFAPTPDQVQQVKNYLQSQGFTVTSVSKNGLLIDANATVSQAEAAFQVAINNYVLGNNSFYANAGPPVIPGSLSSLILSIGGLDNSVKMHPLYHLSSPSHGKQKPALKGQQPHANPRATPSGYGPTELNGAYDAAPLHQAGIDGSNQTVAVFELDGYQSSDITQYLQQYNLGSPSITNVMVDGFNGSAGAGAIEVELDIEVVAAMAPKANQIVYEGPNTTQGVNDTYNQIVTDKKAQIMTVSWGECESQSGNAELQTLDNIFSQGAAEGISMYAASGDSGAYDCNDTNLAVDSPAGDPNITGVGGTNLQLNGTSYGSESVWSNPSDTQRSPKGAGGGGGLSSFFKQPTWQVGPGVQNQYSNGNRQVPDVSADADPASGYAVYCTASASGCPSTGWITVGGTSAAAPMWAGSTALINNYLQSQQKSLLGFANPTLYALANSQVQYPPFHDVTSGDNLYYPATAGYDEASGLGSPDIYNIARDVAAGVTQPPSPSPTPNPSPTGTGTATPVPTDTATPQPTTTTTPAPTITPQPSPTQPGPGGSLIQNGDFEQGPAVWQEQSAGGYELIDTTNPHSGQYSGYLCGYGGCDDTLSQDFTIPSSANSLSIDYWWYGQSVASSQSCADSLTVTVLDSSGAEIGKVQSACDSDATDSWRHLQVNASSLLSNYAGQTVTLVFHATSSSSSQQATAFFIDDVVVNAA